LPVLHGKKAVVFCTFAINAGKTLEKLVAIVESRGAEVVGGQTMRRDHLDRSATEFVDRLVAAVPS
jgi:hypothetical protein